MTYINVMIVDGSHFEARGVIAAADIAAAAVSCAARRIPGEDLAWT